MSLKSAGFWDKYAGTEDTYMRNKQPGTKLFVDDGVS